MDKTKVLNIDALCITKDDLLKGLDNNLSNGSSAGNGVLIYHKEAECEYVIL